MLQMIQRNAFEKIHRDDQKILALKNFAKSYALVLFTGNNCEHCEKMKLVLNRVIPLFENKIFFLTINLSEFPELVEASSDTATKITYVPYVVVYADNIPFKIYDGKYNDIEVQQFLNSIFEPRRTQLSPVPAATGGSKQQQQQQPEIKCVGKYCYLTFREAYN